MLERGTHLLFDRLVQNDLVETEQRVALPIKGCILIGCDDPIYAEPFCDLGVWRERIGGERAAEFDGETVALAAMNAASDRPAPGLLDVDDADLSRPSADSPQA